MSERRTMPYYAYPDWWMGVLKGMSAQQAAERLFKECAFKYSKEDIEKAAAAMTAFHAIRTERGT